MRKKTWWTAAVGSSLLALAAIGPWTIAGAQEASFSDESIAGTWVLSASGSVGPAVPAAAVGLVSFDGAGGCSITDQINLGGVAVPSQTEFRTSATCDYQVNGDGTGTMSVFFPGDPGPIPLTFAIVDAAEEIRFIRPDYGIASGVMKRQAAD